MYTKHSRSLRAGRSGDRILVGANFPHPPRPAMGATWPPVQLLPGLFPGVKAVSGGVNHPPPCITKIK